MKKILLSSLVAAAAAMPAFAGVENINYQAVIKDGNSVVANKAVELKFELLENNEVVYTEDQSVITNAAGYVACQLGGDEALQTLNWGDLTLRVSLNLGGGYEIISNEAVSSVPTALYALRSADSDEIKAAVEELMNDTELNKETILGINAELVRLDGMTEEFATNEQVDAFATMLEERLDKMQNQMDETDNTAADNYDDLKGFVMRNVQNISGLQSTVMGLKETVEDNYDDLKGSVLRLEQDLTALQGKQNEDIEALSGQVEAAFEMNQTVIDKIQKQADTTDADLENIKENLTNSFTAVDAKFEEIDGQLENLNNVAAVTRANEEAIEELNTNTEAFATMVEGRFDKVEKGLGDTDADIENIKENLTNSFTAVDAKFEEIDGQLENLNHVAAVTRANEEQIEETIMPALEDLTKENGEINSKLLSMSADIAQIDGLGTKVEQLEDVVKTLMAPDGEGSLNEYFGMFGEQMQEMMNEMIAPLQSKIAELEAEIAELKK